MNDADLLESLIVTLATEKEKLRVARAALRETFGLGHTALPLANRRIPNMIHSSIRNGLWIFSIPADYWFGQGKTAIISEHIRTVMSDPRHADTCSRHVFRWTSRFGPCTRIEHHVPLVAWDCDSQTGEISDLAESGVEITLVMVDREHKSPTLDRIDFDIRPLARKAKLNNPEIFRA